MRKHFIRTFVALLLVFAMAGTTAFADSAVVIGDAVNLREGPGISYRVLDTLKAGTVVEVTDRSNGSWYAVSYHGQSGYMSAGYLSMTAGSNEATVVSYGSSSSYEDGYGVIVLDGTGSTGGNSAPSTTIVLDAATPAPTSPAQTAAPTAPSVPYTDSGSANEGSAVIILADGSTPPAFA